MATLRTVSRCSLLLAFVILLVPKSLTAAEPIVLTAEDGKTAQIVASMVSNRHINHPEINDALSEKLLHRYLEIWDPQKLYLLQSDIDEFSAEKTSLDDRILKGDVQFAVARNAVPEVEPRDIDKAVGDEQQHRRPGQQP